MKMKNGTFISSLNGNEYNIKDVARVPNRTLQTLYLKCGLRPIDMYPSLDNDEKDIIVMLFLREESQPYYQKWLDYTLSDYIENEMN